MTPLTESSDHGRVRPYLTGGPLVAVLLFAPFTIALVVLAWWAR